MTTPAKFLTVPQWMYDEPERPYYGDESRPDPRLERQLLLDALSRRAMEDEIDG